MRIDGEFLVICGIAVGLAGWLLPRPSLLVKKATGILLACFSLYTVGSLYPAFWVSEKPAPAVVRPQLAPQLLDPKLDEDYLGSFSNPYPNSTSERPLYESVPGATDTTELQVQCSLLRNKRARVPEDAAVLSLTTKMLKLGCFDRPGIGSGN
jgi:hypothetical protein